MYIEVTKSIFQDEFQSVRPNQFTYAGLNTLFDYLEEYEHDAHNGDAGDSVELDVIAICCDFSQYDSIDDALKAFNLEDRDELEGNTVVLNCADSSVIVQNY